MRENPGFKRAEEKMAEYSKRVDDSFQAYRQSGLGLSATLITLALVLIKIAADKTDFPIACGDTLSILTFGTLLIGIVSAVGIQVSNYFGLKSQADRHFPEENSNPRDWFKEKTRNANIWFTRSTEALQISLVTLIIGCFFVGYLWLVAKKQEVRLTNHCTGRVPAGPRQ